jgi:hypothetical protein
MKSTLEKVLQEELVPVSTICPTPTATVDIEQAM